MSNSATASANGASGSVVLAPGPNVISIYSTLMAATAEALLQTSIDDFADNVCQHKDPDDSTADAKLTVSNVDAGSSSYSRQFVMYGPGQARIYVSNYSGSDPITIDARPSTAR